MDGGGARSLAVSLADAVRATFEAFGVGLVDSDADQGSVDGELGSERAPPEGLRTGRAQPSEFPAAGGTTAPGGGWAFLTPPRPSTRSAGARRWEPAAGLHRPSESMHVDAAAAGEAASSELQEAKVAGPVGLLGGLVEGFQHTVGALLSSRGGREARGEPLPMPDGLAASQGFGGRRPACRGVYPPSATAWV